MGRAYNLYRDQRGARSAVYLEYHTYENNTTNAACLSDNSLTLNQTKVRTRGERLGKKVMDSPDSPLQCWRYVDATLAESVESTTFLQGDMCEGQQVVKQVGQLRGF